MTETDIHDSLRRTVKRILSVEGDEHAEWRLMALREAYDDYGAKVDKLRGIGKQSNG